MTQDRQNTDIGSKIEPAYRAYRLNASGRIEAVETIQAVNDDEAKAIAQNLVDGKAIELWERARLIAVYSPETKRSPPA